MRIRVGLIGLGPAWQNRHQPALRMLHDRFDVRAVYAEVPKLAENCAAEFQADPVDGYRALVHRSDVDAVLVLSHSWQGWLPLIAACEAGKAVYCAGDVDFDPVHDAKVRASIEQSGVAFMMEYPRRFAPATLRLKELIATQLGDPQLIFCHSRLREDTGQRREQNGTQRVNHQLIELIDWCRYVVGKEPESVSSTGHMASEDSSSTNTDYRSISLNFACDHSDKSTSRHSVTAQISCGNYLSTKWTEAISFRPPAAMQICCERGVAFIDLPSTLVWFDEAGRHLESLETELPVGERLLQHFHRSVTSLVRNLSDLDDAYRAASILAAAVQSDQEGRRVEL